MATESATRRVGRGARARAPIWLVEDPTAAAAGEPGVVGIACQEGNALTAATEATAGATLVPIPSGERSLRILCPTNAEPGLSLRAHRRELLHVELPRNPSRLNHTDIDWKRDLVR